MRIPNKTWCIISRAFDVILAMLFLTLPLSMKVGVSLVGFCAVSAILATLLWRRYLKMPKRVDLEWAFIFIAFSGVCLGRLIFSFF